MEQSHHRLKQAVHNQLALRGSRDFESREAYQQFLKKLFKQLNKRRQERFEQEYAQLQPLPKHRLASYKRVQARVTRGSMIRVQNNSYSVPSRLIGERVTVRIYAEAIEVWYAQQRIECMPRLHGRSRHRIDYRHVIGSLVRKPGAFAHYRYRADLFPTHRFRMAYDLLCKTHKSRLNADRMYLRVLHLAALEGQSGVEAALEVLIGEKAAITPEAVKAMVRQAVTPPAVAEAPFEVDMADYDALITPETREALTPTMTA